MINEIMEKALNKKAQFTHIEWSRPCKVKKGTTDIITKSVVASNVVIGAGYDNRKVVKEKRESGELPEENQGLRGKKWLVYPTILQSLADESKLYIRINVQKNSTMKSTFFKNGVAVDKSEVEDVLYASEKGGKPLEDVFDISLANVTVLN